MQLWTTVCPQKISWEISAVQTQGNSPTSQWLQTENRITASLSELQRAGITGIRLVIFPEELTEDGTVFNWQPFDTAIALAHAEKLLVDLCLGPYQYPYYPGVRIPKKLQIHLDTPLDRNPTLHEFGLRFLTEQLLRYGNDKRVRGFYLGNEWPDFQGVAGKEQMKTRASEEFMLEAATLLKEKTEKPVMLNTNIDALQKGKLKKTFATLLQLLRKQGRLGFDIYPSQERWKRVPHIRLQRLVTSYHRSIKQAELHLGQTELFFAEVEAQPWGDGRSWYQIITDSLDPKEAILGYTRSSLIETWQNYIFPTGIQEVSLWGSDFWLAAKTMGIMWPIEMVKRCGM